MSGNKGNQTKSNHFVSLRWAVGGVFVLGIVSRLIGLAREVIIAGSFGTSKELDAVFLGLSVPLAICLGLGGGISRAVVPLTASLGQSELGGFFLQGRRRLFRLLIPLAAVLAVSSPIWVWCLIPSGSVVSYQMVLMAGGLGCLGVIGGVYAGYCKGIANSQSRHVTVALSPLAYNVILILSVILLTRYVGVLSLLIGIVLAEWGQVIPLSSFLNRIISKCSLSPKGLVSTARSLAIPSVILMLIGSSMAIVDRYFSAGLEEGAVSGIVYADRLHLLPVMLIGFSLQQPLFTRLSRLAAGNRQKAFERTLELGLRLMMLFSVPVVVVFTILAVPVISLLFQRGAFTLDDTLLTAMALRGYAGAIMFKTMIPLLLGAALARKRVWILVYLYIGLFVLNAVLDYLLVGPLGVSGITVTTSIVSGVMVLATILIVAPGLLIRDSFWRAVGVSFWCLLTGLATGVLFVWMFDIRPRGFYESLWFLLGGVLFISALAGPLSWKLFWKEVESVRRLISKAGKQYVNVSRESD